MIKRMRKKGQLVWSELHGIIKAIIVLIIILTILFLWYGSAEGAVNWIKNAIRFGR
ncbi:MAG: hypothetical protein ABIB47_02230 [Candidatus Woesearchaeota archaeon]